MSEVQENKSGGNNRNRNRVLIVFFIILIVSLIAGVIYMRYKKTHITTDDAYVEGRIHQVAPKVEGEVVEVLVGDNQYVKRGDLLLRIDAEPYKKKLDEAQAALDAELNRMSELKATLEAERQKLRAAEAGVQRIEREKEAILQAVEAAKSELDAQEALLRQAESDYRRAERLYKSGVIPKDRYEKAKTALDAQRAKRDALIASVRKAEVSLSLNRAALKEAGAGVSAQKAVLRRLSETIHSQESMIKSRKAVLELAKLRLSYTRVYAPSDGYVTHKSVEVGNIVRPGMPLMAVVPLSDVYVVANYKETQVERIRPGQKVRIRVDAYPGRVFEGKVESIMAGTGAVFSLFPPENASGNYVKVVQRIPVKIILKEGTDPDHLLRLGMSVVPTVYAR
ncbi:MAG: HlyD family secretion protein [Nitrospirae bacterium]|nr:MAG: HlyD family secretion protein [Nitrospirota bacterium]